MGACRNCGRSDLQDLGPIGRVAPFFLKRVVGMEIRYTRSTSPLKQAIRDIATLRLPLSRVAPQFAFTEMQICLHCSFIQTSIPFRDDNIMRLYRDYRSPSYNQERIRYEPTYAAIAAAVGQDEVEIKSRTTALNSFLGRALPRKDSVSILDYGGSDGKFMPALPGPKFVYEVSNIEPIEGVVRVSDESDLGTYSLVLAAHIFEHVPHPLSFIRKLKTYVAPGGYLYIEVPQETSDENREGLQKGTLRLDIGIHEHINNYCVLSVSSLLEAAGFHLIAIEKTHVDVGWAKADHIRALGCKKGHD